MIGVTNNLVRTLIGLLTIVVTVMSGVLGCAIGNSGVTVCYASGLSPKYAGYAVVVFVIADWILKAIQPGGALYGLFGASAPVVPSSSPNSVAGTATPEQVAQP